MAEGGAASLLLEVGCEELPPLALRQLADSLFDGLCQSLADADIVFDRDASRVFYTPRRMAVLLAGVADRQPDRVLERKGPSVAAAFDEAGAPTRAALGFAASVGQPVEALGRLETDKGEWLYCTVDEPGKPLEDLLYPMLEQVLERLPVPRPMRWSNHDFSFVRPVHWLVVMHGDRVLDGGLYGCTAGRDTRGHRIHAPGAHPIATADDYLERLRALHVLADPEERRDRVRSQVEAAGAEALEGGRARITSELLDEVSNIVEWPVAVACRFDPAFLAVPQEALIASMESHQKFFPVLDADGRLTEHFVVVANIESRDVPTMAEGFEKVIRPRLADAQFFWEQDLAQPLERWSSELDAVVFQKDLGTIGDKTKRIASLSRRIAEELDLDTDAAEAAGRQCKLDLISQMVGEFPELQGTMGGYYLAHAGAAEPVAVAVGEHYRPRFAGDDIPATPLGQVVALADRLDTLLGIFAIGMKPSGNKDPFALRRAALGVIRILEEAPMGISLSQLMDWAAAELQRQRPVDTEVRDAALDFILERLKHHLVEEGASTRQVNAVLAAPMSGLPDLRARLAAVRSFMTREEAERLVAANKRIGNILKKQEKPPSATIDTNLFSFEEEKALFDAVKDAESAVAPAFETGEYGQALQRLADLQAPVDRYFDSVMVMDEDPRLRDNRLSQLASLKALFDQVADFSQAD